MSPTLAPSVSYTIVLRLEYPNLVGSLRRILSVISEKGGDAGTIEILHKDRKRIVREVQFAARDLSHAAQIVQGIRELPDMRVLDARDLAIQLHDGGKLSVQSKLPVQTQHDLSLAYTPGVARVCNLIHDEPEAAWALTTKRNTVAVVTDGSAILGLGNLGPAAALPVMEGKAMLFKEFAGVDAWPICLATNDPDEIVRTVVNLAPGFGGINLEDISAPRCFQVERELRERLDIPVFHDDQHGTAVVVLAALLNAAGVVNKRLPDLRVVINGMGAAGLACGLILLEAGVTHVTGVDRYGILCGSPEESPVQAAFARRTNPTGFRGSLRDAIREADVFIGVSAGRVLDAEDIKLMAPDPIIFALANPDPEVLPEEAAPYAAVMATGRSDYPNQINNVLAFPGIFRGALDVYAREINEPMKLAAARAIAGHVSPDALNAENIIPSIFDREVSYAVAAAVAAAARATGVARELKTDYAREHL